MVGEHGACDCVYCKVERCESAEARLAACEALVERWRVAADSTPDTAGLFTNGTAAARRWCADELEAAIRGETNDEQAG